MSSCLLHPSTNKNSPGSFSELHVLQLLPFGVVVLNHEGKILYANYAALKFFFNQKECELLRCLPFPLDDIWQSCLPGDTKSSVCKANNRDVLVICSKVDSVEYGGIILLQDAKIVDNLRSELDDTTSLNQELEAIFASSYDELFVTDGDGKTLRASKACERHYGLTAEQLMGRYVHDLEKEEIFKPSATLMAIKNRQRVTMLQETNNGRKLIATANPVFDDEMNITRVVSNTRDVTELMQMGEQLEEALEKVQRYRNELEQLRKSGWRPNLVGRSSQMDRVLSLARKVAIVDTTVLLLGETGCGKSSVANVIHQMSPRSKGPFIDIDCGAIPHSLLESELFGYEEGAFTGAKKRGKSGLIEMAEHGTLFLDEIAELPLNLQVKLLRVIQERKLLRVGGTKPIVVNTRIIAATNKDLAVMVSQGTFREDLFYRLNVVPINIPPLRERKDAIPHLIEYFLKIYNQRYCTRKQITREAIDSLCSYHWPGNIRELENILERLVVISDEDIIDLKCLPDNISPKEEKGSVSRKFLKDILEDIERKTLEEAWKTYRNTYQLADFLGISQSTAVRKLQKYSILK